MERLTFYDKKAKTFVVKASVISEEFHTPDNEYVRYGEIVDKLAEYENAEEQGQWVRLPVAIGGKVWCIKGEQVVMGEVTRWQLLNYTSPKVWINVSFRDKTFNEIEGIFALLINKTIFLTEAEVLQALKEKERG